MTTLEEQLRSKANSDNWRQFPWWLITIIFFLLLMAYALITGEEYNAAYNYVIGGIGEFSLLLDGEFTAFIGNGLSVTIYTTLVAFLIALVIGLLAGLGRVSQNTFVRNLSITYVEFIRGVPTLVLMFTLALVIVPSVAEAIGIDNQNITLNSRAIAALAIIYGAFLAEIFRAGIESIPRGQMEAARSLGMNARQAMTYIILPQAIRNIMPALGNDFIAMLKDSSLVSVLAVRDITQQAKLYAGSSFRYRETYLVLTFLYLTMTITLSLILRWYERRLRQDAR